MKILRKVLPALALFTALGHAQTMKVAVVNSQRALLESKAGKAAKAALEKEFGSKLEAMQKEIQTLDEGLRKQAAHITEKARNEKGMQLQQKLGAFNELRQQSQMKEAEKTQGLLEEFRALMPELAREHKADYIFEGAAGILLYARNSTDLTEEAIRLHDSKNAKGGKKKK